MFGAASPGLTGTRSGRGPAPIERVPDVVRQLVQPASFGGVTFLLGGRPFQPAEPFGDRLPVLGEHHDPREFAQHRQQSRQHRRIGCAVELRLAADHVEQVGQVWSREYHPWDVILVPQDPAPQAISGEFAQGRAARVQSVHGGGGGG